MQDQSRLAAEPGVEQSIEGGAGDLALGRRRLVVVVALAAALLVQGAYSFLVVPEPYPTVRMPSFPGAPDRSGMFPTTDLTITVTYLDGTRIHPGVERFMAPFRTSASRGSADHVFSPGANRKPVRPVDAPDVRAFVARRARALGGGRTPAAVDFCYREADLDVHTGRYVDLPPCDLVRVQL